jgi:hypothetical protein
VIWATGLPSLAGWAPPRIGYRVDSLVQGTWAP